MSGWHAFLKSVNEELKRTNPILSYSERLKIASDRWKDRKILRENIPVNVETIQRDIAGLQEDVLKNEPTEDMIDNILSPVMKLKGMEFDKFILGLSWIEFAKLLTIIIGQPDCKLAYRVLKRIIPVREVYSYKTFYHKCKDEQSVDMLFWCLYNLEETPYLTVLLDLLVSTIPNRETTSETLKKMGMRILYDMDDIVEMKDGGSLTSAILIGRYLKKIPLETLEKLVRQMTTQAMFICTPGNPSFSESMWRNLTNFSMTFHVIYGSRILHHLLLDDRFVVSPITIKLLSIMGEEGEKIAERVFVGKLNPDVTLAEQYCEYIIDKYGEKNFMEAISQTALSLCFTNPTHELNSKEAIMNSIRERKHMYDGVMKKKLILSEDYFAKKINEVFFSTQEEIMLGDVCFQTTDNCLFSIDELAHLKKTEVNPFTNTRLSDKDIARIGEINDGVRPVLESITESSSMFCDLRLMKQFRNSHLDLMMNKSFFLGYATKFSVALDKIFTSNIILNTVFMYMYEPYMLNPRSENTDYRQGLYPLGKILSLQDEVVVRKYWQKASEPTGLYEERRRNFTWLLIFLMEMYGYAVVNLFAYVVENFVVCLP